MLSSFRGVAAALLVAGGALGSAVAAPTLIGTSVTATFSSPLDGAAFDFSDTRAIGAGVEFKAGDTDPVLNTNGAVPAVNESIDFGALTISFVLIDGLGNGDTGWAAGAQWVFSGLDVGLADTITGVSVTSATGFTSFDVGRLNFTSPNTLAVNIGELGLLGANTADRVGRLTLTLNTRANEGGGGGGDGGGGGTVPEPTTLALVGLGLLAASRARRRFAA